jgi:hypothetical protein
MLAADSKVLCAPVTDATTVPPACDWRQIIEPVEPFLEAVSRRLATPAAGPTGEGESKLG